MAYTAVRHALLSHPSRPGTYVTLAGVGGIVLLVCDNYFFLHVYPLYHNVGLYTRQIHMNWVGICSGQNDVAQMESRLPWPAWRSQDGQPEIWRKTG